MLIFFKSHLSNNFEMKVISMFAILNQFWIHNYIILFGEKKIFWSNFVGFVILKHLFIAFFYLHKKLIISIKNNYD